MNLEDYYKKFNFPASSTFLKLLKNEGLKYTKDEVDKFIKGRTEQQQTTIKTETNPLTPRDKLFSTLTRKNKP